MNSLVPFWGCLVISQIWIAKGDKTLALLWIALTTANLVVMYLPK